MLLTPRYGIVCAHHEGHEPETMNRQLRVIAFACLFSVTAEAEDYDYFSANRQLIRNGVQAVLTCNGLFTSHRTLQQVFDQELDYLSNRVGDVNGGDYEIHEDLRAVAVGGGDSGPVVRSAFREGIGCIVMAPDQTFDNIIQLPQIRWHRPQTENTPWPMGDATGPITVPDTVDAKKLMTASDWAFDRDTPEQDTLSLLIVHNGRIIHERYAPGIDRDTRTRTWSTAKSIAVTLIGILVDQGRMKRQQKLDFDWLPEVSDAEDDPRDRITLTNVLRMSSGLYPVDSFGMEYATGSGLAYWAGASSVEGALSRGLIREPGEFWDYENYDTLLAVYAMKQVLGDDYLTFPSKALLNPLGMHNTLLSTDRFGDFILSSQVYTNARDLARFGLLYLNRGMWQGERLLSEEWIDFVRTPAPASAKRNYDYGAQWWLVPDNRKDVPADAYSTAGNRGQYVIVVPSHDLVIVRRGLDYGRQGFNRWDLTREVLKAFARPG